MMNRRGPSVNRRGPTAWLACAAAATTIALAAAEPSQAQQVYATTPAHAPYAQEALDQMLAPIALYPDALLAQVLMAATYPRDVVEADRFMQDNPGLSSDALADAVEATPWDPSVRALTQFPSVLAMMSAHPEWTGQLGDAFLAQRGQVMDTVQVLRARAHAAGNLPSSDQQRVVVRNDVIAIEPVHAGLLWVPFYDPRVVFGPWWWPTHRPFFWVPPTAYRPPRFADVYVSGFVWGPRVPLRPRLWIDARPVWRDHYVVIDNRRVNNVIVTRPGTQRPTVWQHDPGRAHRFDRHPPPMHGTFPRPPAFEPPHPIRPRPPAFEPPRHAHPPPAVVPPVGAPIAPPRRPDASQDYRSGRPPGRHEYGQRRDLDPPPRPEWSPRRIEKPVPVPRAEPHPRSQPPAPSMRPPAPSMHTPAPRGEPPQHPAHPRHPTSPREPGLRGPS